MKLKTENMTQLNSWQSYIDKNLSELLERDLNDKSVFNI